MKITSRAAGAGELSGRGLYGYAAAGAFILLMAAFSLHRYNSALKGELSEKESEYETLSASAAEGPPLEEAFRSIEAAVKELERGVIEAGDAGKAAAVLAEEARSIASRHGIGVASLRPLPAFEKNGYMRIPVELVFRSGMDQLKPFLFDIQAGSALMRVRELSIRRPEGAGGGLDVKVVLEGLMKR